MSIDDLLKKEPYDINYEDWKSYIASQSIDDITPKDLNKLLIHTQGRILLMEEYSFIYSIASAKESNETMKFWARVTGVLTIVVTLATLVNLYLYIVTN